MIIKNDFLCDAYPHLKKLIDTLRKEYSYVSILGVASRSKSYALSRQGKTANADSLFNKNGFVLRAIKDGAVGEYSFNYIDEKSVDEIASAVVDSLSSLSDLPEGLSTMKRTFENETPMSKAFEIEVPTADELKDEEILSGLNSLRELGLSTSSEVFDVNCRYNYRLFDKIFLSDGRELYQKLFWQTLSVSALGRRSGEVKYYFKGFSSFGKDDLFAKAKAAMPAIVKGLVDVLSSSPMIPGEYDCICAPDVTGMIAHEAFGHGVEEDMFVKDRALASRYLGKYVASPLVTMRDGARSGYDECASYFFDDEGVLAHDTVIIDKGILSSGINDALSAATLGFENTGNGRRESYERKAYTRMTNTYFEAGDDEVEDMIASIKYGFLLENASSGMEDPKNWGIQCAVNMAREIENGKLTGKVFSPVMLTGYVPDLLKSITMISKTPELCGTGFCGKGYKEWVKVSDGGPYIKAKIRLG